MDEPGKRKWLTNWAAKLPVTPASSPSCKSSCKPGIPSSVGASRGMDSLELWVDRGDGKGFVFLAIDTVPGYTDTAALPAPGASAVWKYKGIYRESDAQVGQWSDVATTTVAG
jgi:hypothetical protein